MNESDKNILIKSLTAICNFPKNIHLVNSPNEFLEIHNRNVKMLIELGQERKSEFIQTLINEYPTITLNELKLYISNQKKEKSLLSVVTGDIISSIFNLIKNKGVSFSQIKNKLNGISALNEKLIKIVEDPIFEEIYIKTM
ncbi:hypothetical protein [uncultured Flavobacterium sp.]|mgnify:CR=1 FL=1|uniref:hypothetical protein n=1 Tax=uncultured Flavobacterium sp. TaxID=165435 RepID=UPI0030EF3F4B|tara:strand:+ start:282188 stop:282610 length:423 start_codon:yes stop_codon:yes gene_type:complete